MSSITTAHSAGGFVSATIDGRQQLLLIKNSFDKRWTIPKGHLDPGETPEQAAVREIQEEAGIDAEIIELLGKNRYHFRFRGEHIKKQVDVYLLKAVGDTTLDPAKFDPEDKLVADARWFMPEDAIAAIGYANLRELAQQAASRLEANV